MSITAAMLLQVTLPGDAQAGGPRILDQSASAAGQNNAFIAQADDPSAVYYNPAGMTQLRGVQFSLGTLLAGGETEFRSSTTGQKSTGNFDGSVAYPPPSHVYVTANLKDLGLEALGDVSAGLGILSPFGVLYRWPEDSPFNTAVTFEAFELIDIKPTIAFKLNDQLSFGLGADVYTFFDWWGEGQYQYQTRSDPAFFPLAGIPPGSGLEVNGDDTAAGFNVSLLYTPFRNADGKPLANVGLIYRSQATLHLDGDFLVNGTKVADSEITVVIPQVITGGVALWPIRDQERDWKVELDVDYTGWKSVRNTDIRLSNGLTIPYPRDWESGFTIMVGTEHKWLRPDFLPNWEVALRGGYSFSQNAVPDTFFNPTVPDSDYHSVSVGAGFLCKGQGRFFGFIPCGDTDGKWYQPKGIGLDISYRAQLYEDRTVSGANHPLAPSTPGNVNGQYETTFHLGMVTMRVMF